MSKISIGSARERSSANVKGFLENDLTISQKVSAAQAERVGVGKQYCQKTEEKMSRIDQDK